MSPLPEKTRLRREMAAARAALSPAEASAAARAVCAHLRGWSAFREASCVCAYASFRSELSTEEIIRVALSEGKKVSAPKVFGENLRFFFVENPEEDLERGAFGVPEPRASCLEADPAAAGVCLVPGLAFDERGGRVGYGKGFYDRFLGALPAEIPTVGLAFDFQVVARLAADPHDVPVRFLATPARGIFPAEPGR